MLAESLEMYRRGVSTGVNGPNRAMVESALRVDADLSQDEQQLLVDPQTSGGLLVALPAARAVAPSYGVGPGARTG